jgi:hypothetical protein
MNDFPQWPHIRDITWQLYHSALGIAIGHILRFSKNKKLCRAKGLWQDTPSPAGLAGQDSCILRLSGSDGFSESLKCEACLPIFPMPKN